MTSPQLHPAILPLLQSQHACFGHRVDDDDACRACIVHLLCDQQKARRLVEFAADWERFHRLKNRSETLTLITPTACSHCRKIMHPNDGKVLHVEHRGTYHTLCVDLAFPISTS